MASTCTYQFDTTIYKGAVTFPTQLFINGEFVDPVNKGTIDLINPATCKAIARVSLGDHEDIEIAAQAARAAFKEHWGLKVSGEARSKLLHKLADLVDANTDQIAALEALNVGKTFHAAKAMDLPITGSLLRYYAGWADKLQGKSIQTTPDKIGFTRHEPIGVVGAIVPWNFPLSTLIMKLAPALACGNTIVAKPSEFTPLSALYLCTLIREAGFPPGVVNIVPGYGDTAGQAVGESMIIDKVAFTGSTLTGRKIMEAAARSNLKKISLELGGKSPSIIFNDADVDQAVKWAINGIFMNQGELCVAGSRIYVQEGIYDDFLQKFTESAQCLSVGDPFSPDTFQGPQISERQFKRVMDYIKSGQAEGATLRLGGERYGTEGYFIQPTIFTDCTPNMKIVQEEIFGPVAAIMKFSAEEGALIFHVPVGNSFYGVKEVIEQANNTTYGLACSVYTKDIDRAMRVASNIEAGTAWVNFSNWPDLGLPVGGFKQSGMGRDLGEDALENYTNVKAVHINIGIKI
ncbi:putative 1-pyrroline-5-carboxylate dehydrogenase [Suillus subalutaceus]|uniref:putative 1-pyrroline-5-carboxylate dehydrogenase n=1 Tax=Suillus subalutaceus TaxID=48586 RepID=UPI001B86F829|nr:putative 1-pyrroline-5-carboxylate dehydrogenase [Suillus subalutaceus]KAG1851609.1 putative 1-pyrroline-5-carboxylate dehydrogenase [Suillus subalutaceus]